MVQRDTNAQDMRDAVLYEPGWTGGLAYPDHNIVIIGIAPDPDVVRCDLPVEVVFEDITADITLPKFRPLSA